jgi:hypothetical protein
MEHFSGQASDVWPPLLFMPSALLRIGRQFGRSGVAGKTKVGKRSHPVNLTSPVRLRGRTHHPSGDRPVELDFASRGAPPVRRRLVGVILDLVRAKCLCLAVARTSRRVIPAFDPMEDVPCANERGRCGQTLIVVFNHQGRHLPSRCGGQLAAKSCPRGFEVFDFVQPGWRGEFLWGDSGNRDSTGLGDRA